MGHPGPVVLGRRRRVPHHRRTVGRRQIDAAQHHRPDRHGERRRDRVRRRAHRLGASQRALRPGLDRRIGYVTQDDNLLPWRTTLDNVLFPLEVQGTLNDEARAQRAGADPRRRARRLRELLSARTVRRHAQARGADPHAGLRPADDPDGRAVRRGRRADPHAAAGRSAEAVEPRAQDHHLRHPRHHRGDRARRPRAGADAAARPHRRRAPDPDPAAAQRQGHLRAAKASRRSTSASGRTCNEQRRSHLGRIRNRAPSRAQWIVHGGRILLARRAAARLGLGRAHARAAVLRAAARTCSAHRRAGRQRPAVHRYPRDAARLGARLRHRLHLPASSCRSCCGARRARPKPSSPTSWPRWASRNTRWRPG